MRICVLRLIILVLTQSCASEEKDEVNFVTNYPVETSSQIPIGRRLPHYKKITAGDQSNRHPDNAGHIRFEGDPSNPKVNFENNQEHQFDEVNQSIVKFNLGNTPFGGNQNDRILTLEDQFKGQNTHHKIYFNAPFPPILERDNAGKEVTHANRSPESVNDAEQALLADYEKADENEDENSENLDDYDVELSLDFKSETAEADKNNVTGRVAFEGDNKKEKQEFVRKTKRKPRRKPRVQSVSENNAPITHSASFPSLGYPGYPGYPGPVYPGSGDLSPGYSGQPHVYPLPGYPGGNPGYPTPGYPGLSPNPGYGPVPYPGQDDAGAGYPGQPAQTGYPAYGGYGYAADPTGQNSPYRPHPEPQGYYRPPQGLKTLTQRAISAVTEALTSIALFDDKRCVPRLLCEVASGSTARSPTLQKATAGLRPLLTVLQSYNGMSSSPLFLFGHAAVLGITSKDNPTSCRYAYPQCPKDPDGLINYLNNHNGGFFRFFGQPKSSNQQQNLEQFYNKLAGQYGYQRQQQLQQQQLNQQQGQQKQQNYEYNHSMQNIYGNGPNDGNSYHREQNTLRNSKYKDSEITLTDIEARIQNKPAPEDEEDEEVEHGSKWAFPGEESNKKREVPLKRQRKQKSKTHERPARGERGGGTTLKFPDERGPVEDIADIDREIELIRRQKGIFFPSQNHFNIQTKYPTTTPVNLEEYVFDYKHNFYVKRPKPVNNDNSETLYIVRGNGDPNHPEIIKVRPGQSA